MVPVLLATGGVAMDMTNMLMAKNHLQDATDAAALAASSALVNQNLTNAEAKLQAKEFLKTQMLNWATSGMTAEQIENIENELSGTAIKITEEKAILGNAKKYTVEVSAKFDLPLNAFTRLLGKDTTEIGATSKSISSTEARNALSMYLVLDQSGSMASATTTKNPDQPTIACGKKTCDNFLSKIAALKLATANLLTQLHAADPTLSLVRLGSVSYSTKMLPALAPDWGVKAVLAYVNALPADGFTDSSDAIKTAYKALANSSEDSAHKNKNGQVPKKFIVFMTDGENNYYKSKPNDTASDTATRKTCDKARADGMEVYTVAFMAPARGQDLLKYCATTTAHYFPAENATELTAAFKYIGEKASQTAVRLTK
ncbi:vWA domain-containing protein [Pararhizobium sp. O133]|uniref:vWA domain-containing protein n=1 Tax=Pararhizobium sp. O133 TaxID=3449278 RepID=UPI003F682899